MGAELKCLSPVIAASAVCTKPSLQHQISIYKCGNVHWVQNLLTVVQDMVSQEFMPINYLYLHSTVWCCQEQFGLEGWLSQDESSFKSEFQNPKQGGGGRSEWHTTEREGKQQTEVGGLCSETGDYGGIL